MDKSLYAQMTKSYTEDEEVVFMGVSTATLVDEVDTRRVPKRSIQAPEEEPEEAAPAPPPKRLRRAEVDMAALGEAAARAAEVRDEKSSDEDEKSSDEDENSSDEDDDENETEDDDEPVVPPKPVAPVKTVASKKTVVPAKTVAPVKTVAPPVPRTPPIRDGDASSESEESDLDGPLRKGVKVGGRGGAAARGRGRGGAAARAPAKAPAKVPTPAPAPAGGRGGAARGRGGAAARAPAKAPAKVPAPAPKPPADGLAMLAAAAGAADAADKSPRGSTPPPPQQPRDLSPDFSRMVPASGVYRVAENSRNILITPKSTKVTGGTWAQVGLNVGAQWYLAFPEFVIVKRDSGDRIPMVDIMGKPGQMLLDRCVKGYNEDANANEKPIAVRTLGLPEKFIADFTSPQIIRQLMFIFATDPRLAVRIYVQREDGLIECPDTSFTRINHPNYTMKDPEPVSLLFTMDLTTMTPTYQTLKFYEEEPASQQF